MPEAITSNYKGIIQAIKEKSNNTDLSYPSNFYGIVSALVDAIGFNAPEGGGATPLPPGTELPGAGDDGDLVVMPNADGNYFLYVRVDDQWHRIHVTTQEVETAGSAPAAKRTRVINRYKPIAKKNRLGDPGVLTNQQDINHYLFDELEKADNVTQEELKNVWAAIDELPVTIAEDSPDGEEGDLWWKNTEDSLQLFIYYNGDWVPASPPVNTDDIEDAVFQLQSDVKANTVSIGDHENRLQTIVVFDSEPPTIYGDEDYGDGPFTSALNSKFWVNTDTDQLHILRRTDGGYEYKPVAPEAAAPDLQAVMEVGNVTSIPMGVANESGSITIVNPGKLEIQEIGKPEIRMLDITDMDFMDIGMDEDHGHISLSNPDDVLHFKFSGLEKVTFKGKGDAVFAGKVKVQPGTENNEVVTYQQLAEIEEQMEDIVPSLERGLWEFSKDAITLGLYNIYRDYTEEYCLTQWTECSAGNADDPSAMAKCNRELEECKDKSAERIQEWTGDKVWFNQIDINSTLHQWDTVEAGEKIEIVNEDGSGFALYEVDEGMISVGSGRIGIPVIHERSQGIPNGVARVKLFTIAGANAADFVRKDGDTMNGALTIQPDKDTETGLVVFAGKNLPAESKTVVFAVTDTKGNSIFEVKNHGRIKAGTVKYTPQYDTDIVTKKYVDDSVRGAVQGPATHKWIYRVDADKLELQPGEFTGPQNPKYGNGKHYSYYFHPKSLTGEMAFYKDFDMYFPMNALWGAFHYNREGAWKLKQYVPVRNIHMFKDDKYLEIYSHTDYPSGGDIISSFDADLEYYFSIGGMI